MRNTQELLLVHTLFQLSEWQATTYLCHDILCFVFLMSCWPFFWMSYGCLSPLCLIFQNVSVVMLVCLAYDAFMSYLRSVSPMAKERPSGFGGGATGFNLAVMPGSAEYIHDRCDAVFLCGSRPNFGSRSGCSRYIHNVMNNIILSCRVLSCLFWSRLVSSSNLVVSWFVSSRLVSSCLVLSCLETQMCDYGTLYRLW